jgi:hypothetical protein
MISAHGLLPNHNSCAHQGGANPFFGVERERRRNAAVAQINGVVINAPSCGRRTLPCLMVDIVGAAMPEGDYPNLAAWQLHARVL